MKKYLIPTGILSLVAVMSFIAVKPVYADSQGNGQGYFRKGLERTAEILGITAEELTTQKDAGKTMMEIVEEYGMTMEDLQNARTEAAKQRWAESGLSEEEINSRLETMAQRRAGGCTGEPKGPLFGQNK